MGFLGDDRYIEMLACQLGPVRERLVSGWHRMGRRKQDQRQLVFGHTVDRCRGALIEHMVQNLRQHQDLRRSLAQEP